MAATAKLENEIAHDLSIESDDSKPIYTSNTWDNGRKEISRLDAINIRRAARLNALSIKESELTNFLDEHQKLISTKFSIGLNRSEERRLAYVRWNLDKIQDARHGHTLDALEDAIARYENFGDEVRSLVQQLEGFKAKRKR